ncbi:hypothetical protein E2C01_060626 [Portunus trituberculatus]|uniref:Uncharacterized protein n=1 Tax=Portunus trituberculatus TaxID=210409 RepID=A0A5B7HBY8_PORTR|nr:hypothetical protein [Portunus trituberculatus]
MKRVGTRAAPGCREDCGPLRRTRTERRLRLRGLVNQRGVSEGDRTKWLGGRDRGKEGGTKEL